MNEFTDLSLNIFVMVSRQLSLGYQIEKKLHERNNACFLKVFITRIYDHITAQTLFNRFNSDDPVRH